MKEPDILYIEMGMERLEDSTLYESKDAINNMVIQGRVHTLRVGVYKLVKILEFDLDYKVNERKVKE